MRLTLEDRFWAKVNKTSGCWEWTAAKDRRGYGLFSVGKQMKLAHRVAIELATGRAPTEHLDHKCHNPVCVNLNHLRPVSRKQNMENRTGANANNKSGILGVSWHKSSGLWQAAVYHNGKQSHLGYFRDPQAAGEAAKAKRLELFTHNDTDKQAATN